VDAVQYKVKAHAEFYTTHNPPQQSNKTRLLEKNIEWSIKNKKPGWTSYQVNLSAHDIRWIMGTKEVLNNQCGTSCWPDEATCRNYIKKGGGIIPQITGLPAPNANTTCFLVWNTIEVLDIGCSVGSGGVDSSTTPSNWTLPSHKLLTHIINAVERYVFHLWYIDRYMRKPNLKDLLCWDSCEKVPRYSNEPDLKSSCF
jgi:hypothetical protein